MAEEQLDIFQLIEISNYMFCIISIVYTGSTEKLVITIIYQTRYISILQTTRLQLTHTIYNSNKFISQPIYYNIKRLKKARTRPIYNKGKVLTKVYQLYKNKALKFRSSIQQEAIQAIYRNKPAEQVIIIITIGARKILPILIPSQIPGAGTTIIIISIVSLRYSLIRQINRISIRQKEQTS